MLPFVPWTSNLGGKYLVLYIGMQVLIFPLFSEIGKSYKISFQKDVKHALKKRINISYTDSVYTVSIE